MFLISHPAGGLLLLSFTPDFLLCLPILPLHPGQADPLEEEVLAAAEDLVVEAPAGGNVRNTYLPVQPIIYGIFEEILCKRLPAVLRPG